VVELGRHRARAGRGEERGGERGGASTHSSVHVLRISLDRDRSFQRIVITRFS
jgi:hypothetical protein